MVSLSEFRTEWDDNATFVKAHTSGSTGMPKPVHLLKADMQVSAIATNDFFSITDKSVLATPLSLDYIAGKMMAVRSFVAGCSLELMPNSNKLHLHGAVDLLAIVPSQIDSLVTDCNSAMVRNVIIGGAPIPPEKRQLLAKSGFNAYTTYGMTETCSHVALSKVTENIQPFKSMPGISFASDERGCLIIKAPKYSFGELVTNDVVELIDDKSFLWKGRADNVINSGGIKIHPELIENIIRTSYPEFPPFYIVGRSSSRWGTEAVMVIEATESEAAEWLKLATSAIVDKRYRPKDAVAVVRLPHTIGGNKIKRILP